jgi:hypothetical protein
MKTKHLSSKRLHDDYKNQVAQEWRQVYASAMSRPTAGLNDSWANWVLLQQCIAQYPAQFHGALTVAYKDGGETLRRMIGALQNAAVAGQRKPVFRIG